MQFFSLLNDQLHSQSPSSYRGTHGFMLLSQPSFIYSV